ncbi:MAG: phosphoadenylyl-sulfate reductase [Sphingomonadales bacterium]
MIILQSQIASLNEKYAGASAQQIIAGVLKDDYPGAVSLVSSFGTESAVLLHMAAQIDSAIDVVFIDTGKLFGETLRYRDRLVGLLGLSRVRTVLPKSALTDASDAKGALWAQNPDRCCYIRKVEPLARALKDVNVWISGRKAFQSGSRAQLDVFELAEGRLKINPLARWTAADIDAYFTEHQLPSHPLEADGYRSIGCMPCTSPVAAGEDPRAGRWRGQDKTECGLHIDRRAAAPKLHVVN